MRLQIYFWAHIIPFEVFINTILCLNAGSLNLFNFKINYVLHKVRKIKKTFQKNAYKMEQYHFPFKKNILMLVLIIICNFSLKYIRCSKCNNVCQIQFKILS